MMRTPSAPARLRGIALAVLALATSSLAAVAPVGAVVISDGQLSVNVVFNDLNTVNFNGAAFDTVGRVQRTTFNDKLLADPSTFTVSPDGRSVTYSGAARQVVDNINTFAVTVTHSIQAGVPDQPNARVLEQRYTITNTLSTAHSLFLTASFDPDIADTFNNDTVAFDSDRLIPYSIDGTESLLAAMEARNDQGLTPAWFYGSGNGPGNFADLTNPTTPSVGPGSVGMGLGLDFGMIDPGETVTATFLYLFSDQTQAVPNPLQIPAPAAAMLLLPGVLLLARPRR